MRPCGCSRGTDHVGNMPSNVKQWDSEIKLHVFLFLFCIIHSLSHRDTPFMMRGDYEIRPALNA